MAITRAQQAKQLLANGGRIGLKGGADASQFNVERSKQKTPNVSAGGASFNKLDDAPSGDDIRRNREEFETAVGKTDLERLKEEGVPKSNIPGLLGLGLNATKKLRDFTLKKNIEYFEDLSTTKYPKTLEGYTQYMQDRSAGLIDAAGNTIMRGGDDPFIPINQMSTNMDQAPEEEVLSPIQQALLDRGDASAFLAKGGRVALGGGSDMGTVADSKGNVGPSKGGYQGGGTGPVEKPSGGGGGDNNTTYDYTLPKEIVKQTAINTGKTYLKNKAIEKLGLGGVLGMAPQVAAILGIINAVRNPQINEEDMQFADGGPVGGIMDLESGRQMYFLGKLVKKATRAVKKIVKSPIGKAALIGGLGYFAGGGGNPFTAAGRGKFSFANIFSKKNPLLFSTKDGEQVFSPLKASTLFSLSPLLLEEDTNEDDYQKFLRERGAGAQLPASIPDIRDRYKDYMATAFLADGGRPEPVAKKTMPLLDMDGKEKDYRETGGFVDMGRMERADDVPARLSKNEFVFTADAVRNAGEGDIDKGAEVMYNMMKNLEAGGEVSEESQGLDGARKMFQTSQRLEEVL